MMTPGCATKLSVAQNTDGIVLLYSLTKTLSQFCDREHEIEAHLCYQKLFCSKMFLSYLQIAPENILRFFHRKGSPKLFHNREQICEN